MNQTIIEAYTSGGSGQEALPVGGNERVGAGTGVNRNAALSVSIGAQDSTVGTGTSSDTINLPDNADAVAARATASFLATIARLTGLNNAGTWDRLRTLGNNVDGVIPISLGVLETLNFLMGFNGTNWDRLRTATATALGGTLQQYALMANRQGDWNIVSAPVAAAQATVTKAAGGALTRHVITGFQAAHVGGAVIQNVQVLFGATLVTALYIGPNGTTQGNLSVSGLNLVAPVNTSVTIQFSAAVAGVSQVVSLQGYTTTDP